MNRDLKIRTISIISNWKGLTLGYVKDQLGSTQNTLRQTTIVTPFVGTHIARTKVVEPGNKLNRENDLPF